MKHKHTILVTSFLVLIPMLAGLLLWKKLPEELPIHFNIEGNADNWGSKAFVVFGMPLFLLAMHLLCTFLTLHDPKKQNISDKMFFLTAMIIPVTSLIGAVLTYSGALGLDISVNMVMHLFLGLLFVIVGNYMPKSRQNYTIGIKLPWTLSDSHNWNRTHRFAGILWVFCGLVLLINAFINIIFLPFIVILLAVVLPVLYSFLLYRKQKTEDK
ncbi:MAG: SdpI family protein [Lachnospiraceae bacterium]|nr:SdpI family protein [Lachnospiraceae bacterium]